MTAIFLWLSTAFNSCGETSDDLLDDTTDFMDVDDSDDIFDDTDDLFEDDSDDIFEDEVEDDYIATDNTDYVDPEPDYTDPTPTSTQTQTAPAPTTHSTGGDYMVIAGNYLVESNANGMIRKLANLGYPNSDIGVFDRSQYHTVIAYRSNSYSSALEVSNAIKRQGIDCYVKRRQY